MSEHSSESTPLLGNSRTGQSKDLLVPGNAGTPHSSSAGLGNGQSQESARSFTESTSNQQRDLLSPSSIVLFLSIYFGVFLAALDTTVVSTLLSHIASDLHELENISWVATAYLVAYSAGQPLYGKISDIYGRKTVLVVCTVVFGVGCLVCGLGSTLTPLVVGRFVSGLGAGGMLSMSTISISDLVPLRKRGIFQGIGNIAFGSGASLGGIAGGWATSVAGWRFAFTAQFPLALICALVSMIVLENQTAKSEEVSVGGHADHVVYKSSFERIDFVGSFSLSISVLFVMFAVTTGGVTFPWSSPVILGSFVLFAVFLYLFFYWEANHAIEPVMPIEVLTNRSVLSACFTNFFGCAMVYAFIFYGPVLLTAVFNYSYNDIGLRVIANFVGVAFGSLGAGFIMRHTGKYYALGLRSTFVMLLAAFMIGIVTYLPPSIGDTLWYQCLAYFICGFGYAAMLTVSLVALISSVPPEQQATVTSAQYTFRGVGSSMGIAVAASVFHNVLKSQLVERLHGKHVEEIIETVLKSVDAIRKAPIEYQPAIITSYANAGVAVFATCGAFGVLATISTSFGLEHTLDADTAEIAQEEIVVTGE